MSSNQSTVSSAAKSSDTSSEQNHKSVLVLARCNHREAMRVAAGLTIFDHTVNLVFMDRPVAAEDANSDPAELLELVDIIPMSTVEAMGEHMTIINAAGLTNLMRECDAVINV